VLRIGSLIVGHWFFATDEVSVQKKVAEYGLGFSCEVWERLALSRYGVALFSWAEQ
jgi:hypothetical protein